MRWLRGEVSLHGFACKLTVSAEETKQTAGSGLPVPQATVFAHTTSMAHASLPGWLKLEPEGQSFGMQGTWLHQLSRYLQITARNWDARMVCHPCKILTRQGTVPCHDGISEASA